MREVFPVRCHRKVALASQFRDTSFSCRGAGGTTGHLVELEGSDLEPVSFQGQVQGVKVPVGSGDTSPSEIHSCAGGSRAGGSGWQRGALPHAGRCGGEAQCPSSCWGGAVTGTSHLVLGSGSRAFCQTPPCTFKKKPENPFQNNCVFPKARQAVLFTLKVKRFSANSSEQGLTHGCSPTSQWVQHGAWFQLCLLLSALTRGGMDGKDGVTRFSLSFPLISHLL